jgi:hypothetical protein
MFIFPIFAELKTFVTHIHDIFYVSVEFKHSFNFETNQSITMDKIAANMIAEVHNRTDQFLAVFDWMNFTFSFFFFIMVFK